MFEQTNSMCDSGYTGAAHHALQVAIAQQLYDYIDQRIRGLDDAMTTFDADLVRDRATLGLDVSTITHAWQVCCTS